MPKIIIIPDRIVENVCRTAVSFANSCQSDFEFYLIPNTDTESIFNKPRLEIYDTEKYFFDIKTTNKYNDNDLVIRFYNGILQATKFGLTNLFCAGSKYDEKYPLAAVISLKYLDWEILEEKYSYEVQKHSILHLIIRCIIGAYTHIDVHTKNNGCIMDFNNDLISFNIALRKGYFLCDEYNCFNKLKKEKYGNSIIRLCEQFKSGNYQTIIKELIMGDKINVGDINHNSGQIAIGKNITIANSQDERNDLAKKIDDLIRIIRQEDIPEDYKQSLITNFDKVREEILDEEQPDKSKIVKWLSKTKKIIENIVLTHEASQAINWIYSGFNFITQNIG